MPDERLTPDVPLEELEKKLGELNPPIETWHPKNWDAVTSVWFSSADGKPALEFLELLVAAAPALIASARHLQSLREQPGLTEEQRVILMGYSACGDSLRFAEQIIDAQALENAELKAHIYSALRGLKHLVNVAPIPETASNEWREWINKAAALASAKEQPHV